MIDSATKQDVQLQVILFDKGSQELQLRSELKKLLLHDGLNVIGFDTESYISDAYSSEIVQLIQLANATRCLLIRSNSGLLQCKRLFDFFNNEFCI